jgi:hypothetical protein
VVEVVVVVDLVLVVLEEVDLLQLKNLLGDP